MTAASQLRLRVISVILIDEHTDRRAVIAEAFREVGCDVIEAATSLEAVVRLGECAFEPDLIAVGDSIPDAAAAEMREFIGRNHPHVKLVAIRDTAPPVVDADVRTLSADPLPGLPLRIRELLAAPMR